MTVLYTHLSNKLMSLTHLYRMMSKMNISKVTYKYSQWPSKPLCDNLQVLLTQMVGTPMYETLDQLSDELK